MEEFNLINLIVRYLSNEATAAEQERLQQWLKQNEANKKLFDEYQDVWMNQLPSETSFDVARGLQRLNTRIDQEAEVPSYSSFGWRKMAAVISIFLVSCVAVYFLGRYSQESSISITWVEHQTLPGEKKVLTLSDGSVVYVNVNSTLQIPETFKGFTREVYLNGEAFFEVAKDSLRPFIIHTGNLSTQVLGTSFNINTKSNQVTVSVVTGKVKVASDSMVQVLMPNEKVVYSDVTRRMIRLPADLENELAWKSNTIIFDDTTLEDAARRLSENFSIKIVFENDALRKCLITGKYKNVPLEKILQAISYSTGVKFTIQNSVVRLAGTGCEQ